MNKQQPIITFEATVTTSAGPQAIYNVLADVSTHIVWAGEQAKDKTLKLLTLDAGKGNAKVGTVFTSTGTAIGSATFHDRSTVLEATPSRAFAFETESQLERKRRPIWEVRFVHRYEIRPAAAGSRIRYTSDVHPQNYRPYWLHPLARPLFKVIVEKAITKNLQNLVRAAESLSVDHMRLNRTAWSAPSTT